MTALFFLPRFLKSGIYTIPEFLEYRYNPAARGIMAFYTMIIYIGVTISAVLYTANQDRFHMFLPADNPELPWTALVIGLWIPNFYYWGLNQYIAQRTLAARSLKDGQLGVLLAAGIQVILPLIIVIPGIIA